MVNSFRKLALEKIAENIGPLSKIVENTLGIKEQKPVKFQTVGTAGPGTTVMASEQAVKPDGTVDIVINLRGLPGVPQAAESLGINAAVVAAEAVGPQSKNMGSSLLEQQFGSAQRINDIVDKTLADLQKKYPDKKLKRGKLIISGFSGGGGAISKLMTQRDQIKGGVDGIIINDGLHTKVNSPAMKALVDFAKEAEKDPSKKFKILHTAIIPWSKQLGRYTSTTETADHILRELGLTKEQAKDIDPSFDFKPISEAKKGGVEIVTMYDKSAPYYEDNRAGSAGDQHIQALKKGHPYLFRDVLS
jgi:hypothetical protein